MGRDIDDWARDSSLYFRLRDSVKEMVRGKGKWGDRAAYVCKRLAPITGNDFPDECRVRIELIREFHKAAVVSFPHTTILNFDHASHKQRAAFCDVLFTLYEDMAMARARLA